ncbi:MAG: helix-turn-helix transcriptional regulator [bacterium]
MQNGDNIKREVEEFTTTLFRNYCQQASAEDCAKSNNTLLRKIENYIIENIEETISIDQIAKTTGYSTAHLNRLFKKEYGLTLHAFLIDQRIHKAKEILSKNREITLTEIAHSVGFYDQSHFIKNFKKAYSLSPKAYT